MRTELERQRRKPGSKSVPEILQADQGKQERIRGLGLSGSDIVSAQRKWLEEIPKSTPEMVALIRAEKELAAFDKRAKERLQGVPLERYIYESDTLTGKRAAGKEGRRIKEGRRAEPDTPRQQNSP